jgi:hypothetical protein
MRRKRSHLMSFRIAALSALLAGVAFAAQGQGIGTPALPDLVLEGPVESGSDWRVQNWTVKNVGSADSTTSSLQVTCEVVYITPNSNTKCLGGTKSVPPMQKKTGSYSVNALHYFPDPSSPGQTTAPKYRLRITAKVDPSNAIKEIDDTPTSNQKVVVVENFSGPPPISTLDASKGLGAGLGGLSSGRKPGDSSTGGTLSAAGSAGPLAAKPQVSLTLSTDKPYKAGESVWIIAKNNSSVASPAAKLKVTCVWQGGKWAGKECGFPALKSREFSVPPVLPGQFQAIGQYGGLVNDCYFQWADVTAGGLACIGTTSNDIPPAHKATLDLQGVMGFNLILEAK